MLYVHQILKLSKQDKGKLDIELREGDIVEFCRNCFSQFLQIAHDKQIQFAFVLLRQFKYLIYQT